MRIAIICYHGSPLSKPGRASTGGMQAYVREASRALASLGNQVDVFTRRDDPETPTIQADVPGMRVISVLAGPAAPVQKGDLSEHISAFAGEVALFAEDECVEYDIIHSHYWLSGRVGRKLRDRWHVPHVTMFHTLAEVKARARVGEHDSAERLRSERLIISDADRIVVSSPHERAQLTHFFHVRPERVSVVPCGVNTEVFYPEDKRRARAALGLDSKWVVLGIGRFEPLKGVDIALRAIAGLDDRREITLVWIGWESDGHAGERERLESLAEELGIADRVQFHAPADQGTLRTYYSAADVTVVPSYYESFGLVAVESLACGTPVVASRVGGLPSAVQDCENGFLIQWRCPEAFGERIELLLHNAELREAFSERAVAGMQRLRWPVVARQLQGVYESLSARRIALAAAS